MTDTQAPKRLHYAWVVVLAFVLMLGSFACWMTQGTAGPGYETEVFMLFVVSGTLVAGVLWGWMLLLWLWMIWGSYGEARAWRGRAWLALSPVLIFFGYCVIFLAIDPPSPQKHFRSRFQAQLPADARDIECSAPRLNDAGYFNYAFRCSKQSTLALIHDLAAEPAENVEGVEAMFTAKIGGVARDWSIQDWRNALCFVKGDRHGTGYILMTDVAMERVVVGRDPLWSKSEGEYIEE